jgi:hypothetical protein
VSFALYFRLSHFHYTRELKRAQVISKPSVSTLISASFLAQVTRPNSGRLTLVARPRGFRAVRFIRISDAVMFLRNKLKKCKLFRVNKRPS